MTLYALMSVSSKTPVEIVFCEYCKKRFIDNLDGVIQRTFHIILRHGDEVDARV